jgi:NitT/TauT family transport system permease protein
MLRRPIGWRWHAALGVLSFVTLAALYTWAAWRFDSDAKADMVAEAKEAAKAEAVARAKEAAQAKAVAEAEAAVKAGLAETKDAAGAPAAEGKPAAKAAGAALSEAKAAAGAEAVAQDKAAAAPYASAEVKEALSAGALTRIDGRPSPETLAQIDAAPSAETLARIEAEGRPTILPTWGRFYTAWKDVTTPDPSNKHRIRLWEDMKATFWRLFVGVLVSLAAALPLGLLMGCYEPVEAVFQPPLAFLAKIPATAMYGVFLILPFIGRSEWLYPAMIIFGIVPNLTQTVYLAAKEDVPEEMLFKARTLGASQFSCIWDVILRQIMPRVLDGIRLAVGPALIFLYAAEMLQADVGIGGMIRLSSRKGVPGAPEMYMYLVIAGLFALLLDFALRRLLRFMCPWFAPTDR